jgi:membrane protease YdiL (CAAX protease family)
MLMDEPRREETGHPWDSLEPVASWRHTMVLIATFLAVAALGALFQRAPGGGPGPSHPRVIPLYLSLLAAEWALVYYTWVGLRRSGVRIADLVGGRYRRPADVARDLILAATVWALWLLVQRGLDAGMGPDRAKSVEAYLPRGATEVGLWIALSLSAGFAEELIFRGYFLRQFAALTRSRPAALLLQAILFGVAHGYQGLGAVIRITFFGLLFGGLALSARSLRPGMAAHAWTDLYAGWISLLK